MNSDPATQLLADLVAIPSMNPMGRTRSGPEYSEKNVADFLSAFLKKNGIDVEVYESTPGRPNVMGFVDAGASKTLMLEAHLDTVHADNMAIDPFVPTIRDGRLYGRGSCDTKGSIAAFCSAVMGILKSGRKLNQNVLLLFVSDEEYRFTGAQAAAKRGLKATYGICGEPTLLSIIHAHKGVTRWRMFTTGVAAHSAYPFLGKNAIYFMAPLIARLEAHASELQRRQPHPLLGTPTLSVGVIEGGQAVNMVPDHCWIEIDRRSLPGESREAILDAVSKAAKDLPNVVTEDPFLSVAGIEIAKDSEVLTVLSGAIRSELGSVRIEPANYATDAGIYTSHGIPTVVFGPGDIAQAHTKEEFLELDQLEKALRIIQRLIAN
jgi:acetylornithine deacetylase